MTYRISMPNGSKLDGATGSKTDLIALARRAGLCVAKAWDDGSVPLYRAAEDARKDDDGGNALGLIRERHNEETTLTAIRGRA